MIAKLGAKYDTPGKISKLLRDAKKRTFGGMLLEYWINGLISGIATHVTYDVGNTILAIESGGPETAAAAAIGALRARMGRAGTRVRIGEVGAKLGGAIREAPAAAVWKERGSVRQKKYQTDKRGHEGDDQRAIQ
jgi:hypothetical protein